MRADLKWKLLLVVALVALCGVSVWYRGIRLGLDLKGGIHRALRVEAQDAALRKRGLQLEAPVVSEPDTNSLLIPRIDAVARDEYLKTVQSELPSYTVQEMDGGLRVTIPPLEVDSIKQETINDTPERIRNRVDAFGVAEAVVQRQGIQSDRILIQLPGVDDPERVKDLVAKPAFLEWKGVVVPPGLEGTLYPGGESREDVERAFGGQLPSGVEVF